MIYIRKNRQNDIAVTLKEKSIYTNSYYLLKVVSNDNLQEKLVMLGEDTGPNPIRYTSLLLTEAPTDDLNNAQLNLIEGMSYDYTFYESPSPTASSIGSWERVVETGTLKVETGATYSTVSTYTNKNTIITYGK
jgi:hypothetical protein